jgi:Domain of unknown function (DUF1929)
MRLGVFTVVVSLLTPALHAQQQQPPKQPFIEPAEHHHAGRAMQAPAPAPYRTGQWTTLGTEMPINPVHAALMHNGKVLVIAGSGADPNNKDWQALVWNPVTHAIEKTITLKYDMFCNGMIVLPDGQPLVLGGTEHYDTPWIGEKRISTFNPSTESFTQKASMRAGRWYPTGTVLGDGTVLTISGLAVRDINNSIDIYHPSSNTWTHSGSGFDDMPLYPRMTLLPNGKVFESGSNPNTMTYTPSTGKWTDVARTRFARYREYGTTVLLPLTPSRNFAARVMILGGGPDDNTKLLCPPPPDRPDRRVQATNTTEIIDLSASAPAWTAGPNMAAPRTQLNATLLPGGRVLVSGGSSIDECDSTAVKAAELYDPETNTFSPAETMEFQRLYHSNTILLPDATVMAVGGNPARGEYEPHVEIYSPPYLFKPDGSRAARPAIGSSTTSTIHYGASFDIHTRYPAAVRSVELIRADANLAPPGWYLLFIVDQYNVPSVAHWAHLTKGEAAYSKKTRR